MAYPHLCPWCPDLFGLCEFLSSLYWGIFPYRCPYLISSS
jgi:hypothetical protein